MKYAGIENGRLVSIGIVADRMIGGELVPVLPVGAVALSDAEYDTIESESAGAEAIIAAVVARAA